MKGMFLTVISLSDNISEIGKSEVNKDAEKPVEEKSPFKKMRDNRSLAGSFKNEVPKRPEVPYGVYKVKLNIHGGPVYCSIVTFSDSIFIVSSDSCPDTVQCAVYLHDTIPHLVPHSHNALLNSGAETNKVVDSYVAPALEVVGTLEYVTLPTHHRGQDTSPELQDNLLEIEVGMEMKDKVCVTCGGLILVSYPHIVYTSLPLDIQNIVLQTLYFRELTAVSQGYVIWFNKLYKHPFKVKQQSWYMLAVCKNNISVAQVLGILGKPDKEMVIRAARDLENMLDHHSNEISQHLPHQAIALKHCQIHGYKYGDSRIFFTESRFHGILEFYHSNDDCGFNSVGKFVLNLEEDLYVAQRVIANKVFTVVYTSKGVHDISTMFCELGI